MSFNSPKVTVFLLVLGCTGLPLATLSFSFLPGRTYRFAYKTETYVNQASSSAASDTTRKGWRDVGVSFDAKVEVTSVWSDDSDGKNSQLIKVAAHDVNIKGHATEGMGSKEVDRLFRLPSFFLLERGLVTRSFVPEEHRLSSNMYAGIASLFQLNEDFEAKEEQDVSGMCQVTYERRGDYKLTKTKRNCRAHDSLKYSNVNEALGVRRESWASIEYSFSEDSILSIRSRETQTLGPKLVDQNVIVVTSSQQLSLTHQEPSMEDTFVAGGVEEAVQKILQGHSKLIESPLKTLPCNKGNRCTTLSCNKLSELVEEFRAAGKTGPSSAGRHGSSTAFQALVSSFRASNRKEILAALRKYKKKGKKEEEAIFFTLVDAAGACQTPSCHKSLVEVLDFNGDDQSLLERFLLSSSLSTHPSEDLISYLTNLSKLRHNNIELRESIDEALGAVVFTYSKSGKPEVADEAVGILLGHLSNCPPGDHGCQRAAARGLSNAGTTRAVGGILGLLERSESPTVGEACVKALRRIDVASVDSEFRRRLRDVFHQRSRGFDPVVRAQVLRLLLRLDWSDSNGSELEEIFEESLDPWNEEFDLYLQSVLFDEAKRNHKVRTQLESQILRNPKLNNYHVLAPNGKSLAFSSELNASPRVDYLMYVQNGRTGSMKRSGMDVDLRLQDGSSLPLYKFELSAAGLGSFTGNGKKDEEEDKEEVTAGMSLDVMGVSLRPITFFVGQGALMSAVWNAPSEPVSAFQINFLLHDHLESLPLGNGLLVDFKVTGIASLDLSGSLSVSLWSKNARSLIRNSGSTSLKTVVDLSTDLFSSFLEVEHTIESGLDFKTDVDFYGEETKMCLQMMTAPSSRNRRLTRRHEKISGHPRSLSSRTTVGFDLPGVSYPLPRSNNEQCRKLFPTAS